MNIVHKARRFGKSASSSPVVLDEVTPNRFADLRYRQPGRRVWRAQVRKAVAAQRRARRQAVSS